MKTYGKRSSSLAIFYAKSNLSDDIELSDDGEVESYEGPSLDEQSLPLSNLTYGDESLRSLDVSTAPAVAGVSAEESSRVIRGRDDENTGSMTIVSSFDGSNSTSDLKAFDFLDELHRPKKKRRTNYKKELLPDIESHYSYNPATPVKKTIDDLNLLLSSLKSMDYESLEKNFQVKLEDSVQDKPSVLGRRVTYGSARTFLQAVEGEPADEDEEDIQEDKLRITHQPEARDAATTHHFNELKNMGDFLKYQDDLEFLTEDLPTSLDHKIFISKLLNLSLAICNDEGFLQYIMRGNLFKVRNWCFSNYYSDPFILLLQGYLLTKLQLKSQDLPSCTQSIIHLLVPQLKNPEENLIQNKMTRLNYRDFLRYTNNKEGRYYALKLYCKYPEQLSSSELTSNVLNFVGEGTSTSIIFKTIETILSTETEQGVMKDAEEARFLLQRLIELLPTSGMDEYFVKSLILLTNDSSLLSEIPKERMTFAHAETLKYVLAYIQPTKGVKTDMVILHLGLALNIIAHNENLVPAESQWKEVRSFLRNVKVPELEFENRFVFYMLYLNFAYMTNNIGSFLSKKEKYSLICALKRFGQESEKYNENIHEKINIALRRLL